MRLLRQRLTVFPLNETFWKGVILGQVRSRSRVKNREKTD